MFIANELLVIGQPNSKMVKEVQPGEMLDSRPDTISGPEWDRLISRGALEKVEPRFVSLGDDSAGKGTKTMESTPSTQEKVTLSTPSSDGPSLGAGKK